MERLILLAVEIGGFDHVAVGHHKTAQTAAHQHGGAVGAKAPCPRDAHAGRGHAFKVVMFEIPGKTIGKNAHESS